MFDYYIDCHCFTIRSAESKLVFCVSDLAVNLVLGVSKISDGELPTFISYSY